MTRFRDAKVCKNIATVKIDDHRIQSGYKCTVGLQNPEGKNSVLGVVCVAKNYNTNDNVTTETQSTFNTAHMNTDT